MDAQEYFEIPKYCPICNSPTILDGQFLFCRSKACPVKLSGSILVWVEKLGLLHWGETLIHKLTDPNDPKIDSIADLYRLSIEDIAECCSGVKVATKCHGQLHGSKELPLQLLISALNIPLLGVATATDIVSHGINTIDRLLGSTSKDFVGVPNIGERTAFLIYDGIQEKRNLILDLAEVVIVVNGSDGLLSGMSFCITGALSKPRKAIEKEIMDSGGSVKGSVGKGLSYLVTNENTASKKMQNAKKYSVKVISENDLYTLIQGNV